MSFLLLLGSPALAQPTPRTVTMDGEGAVSAAPDQAEISAGVTTSAATAAAALSANSARMTQVFASLEKQGVPARAMRTDNFSVAPQYADGNARIIGYRAHNEVHVTLGDVSRVGSVLDTLVSAGANEMGGLSFGIKDDSALQRAARQAAVADARARAQDYAAAAGITLGPILSLSESGGGAPRPVFMAAMAKAVPVAVGEQNVTAHVSIVWEIH